MRRLSVLLAVLVWVSTAVLADGAVNDTALMSPRPAMQLSAYNLFADGQAQAPNKGLLPYDLATPLFTDYAHKYRFIYVPKGLSAPYNDREAFDFPVGSVLVKTFAFPADFRKPEENIRLIETRLLIRQETGWNTWAYVWDADGKDATLKVAGARLPVSWIDLKGETRDIQYVVPNKNQCKGCHILSGAGSPIGPKARNINFTYDYGDKKANQLAVWSDAGLLSGAPAPAKAPHVPTFGDDTADLDARARAYLDVNCAHCHREEGPASTSGLFLTWDETDLTALGYNKRPVAAGRGSGGLAYDIAPGQADQSILIYRLRSTDPGEMMPELGRTIVHDEGVALLKVWINQLE